MCLSYPFPSSLPRGACVLAIMDNDYDADDDDDDDDADHDDGFGVLQR